MPMVPLRDFGRKPNKARLKTEKELEAERRLEQALSRLHAALPLGLVNQDSGIGLKAEPVWYVAESSVQQQASKAILGLTEAQTEHYNAVARDAHWARKMQDAVASAIAPLHFLLGLSNASIVQRAAQACHVAACQLHIWRDAMVPRLIDPLATLVDSKDAEAAYHACASLLLIMVDKPSTRSKGSKVKGFRPSRSFTNQQLFNSFTETCALQRMQRQLENCRHFEDREFKAGDTSRYRTALEVLELLNAALKKSPELLRQAVADVKWVRILGAVMLQHEQRLTVGALVVTAVLAGDKHFGAALLRECQALSAALLKQIESKPAQHAGPAAALQLLAVVAPLHGSDTLLQSERISRALIKPVLRLQADDSLLIESLSTIGALLQHRKSSWSSHLLSSGLAQGLLNLRGWPAPSDRSGELARDPPAEKNVLDPQARKLCWRLLELLGSCESKEKESRWGDLPKLVWSHFYSKVYFYSPGDAGSAEERVEVSRALLSFLSSPSSLSKATRAVAMQDYSSMTEMRIGILPGDPPRHFQMPRTPEADCLLEGGLLKVAALALLDPFRISAATGFRVITLLALKLDSVLAAVSESERSSDAELDGPFLSDVDDQAVTERTRESAVARGELPGEPKPANEGESETGLGAKDGTSGKESRVCEDMSCPTAPKYESEHCGPPEQQHAESLREWEGKDTLLLAALQAFCGLYARWRMSIAPFASAQIMKRPKSQGALLWWEVYSSGTPITEDLFNALRKSLVLQLEGVCSSHSLPPGARCWALRALAELGVYGCPSEIGKEMGKAFKSLDASDVLFRFPDGQSVGAHRAILAARCPALVASTAEKNKRPGTTAGGQPKSDSEVSADVTTVQLSPRISQRAFVCLLEYVYSGQVVLEGPVPAEAERELLLLARKCRLDCLAGLLERRRALPGDRPPVYSLASALDTAVGLSTSDVTLLVAEPASDDVSSLTNRSVSISSSDVMGPARLRAHRIILSARSEYFGALFRSGMRDSITGTIHVLDTTKGAVQAALVFLYTGRPVRPQKTITSGVGRKELEYRDGQDASKQSKGSQSLAENADNERAALGVGSSPIFGDSSLVVYVEAAALAGQWMLERLEELCLAQVKRHLTLENALAVLQAAAARSQWSFAEAVVSMLAPLYRGLINEEGFRDLPEELQEAVRLEHVRLQQEG